MWLAVCRPAAVARHGGHTHHTLPRAAAAMFANCMDFLLAAWLRRHIDGVQGSTMRWQQVALQLQSQKALPR